MALSGLTKSYSNWRKYRQTVDELSRLSRRELADMGISAADIHSVARASIKR